jgi:hypothetical protein
MVELTVFKPDRVCRRFREPTCSLHTPHDDKGEQKSSDWVMRAAAMKVATDIPEAGWTLYDYGTVAFVANSHLWIILISRSFI